MEKSSRSPMWQAVNIAFELGYTIAVPLVLLALAGRWADSAFHTKPWLFLGGVILAMVSSSLLLVRKFSRLIREMNPVRTPDTSSTDRVQAPASKEQHSNGVNQSSRKK